LFDFAGKCSSGKMVAFDVDLVQALVDARNQLLKQYRYLCALQSFVA